MGIVKAVEDKTNLQKLSFDANQFGASGLKQILQKLSDIGKRDIIGETDDNEEPDSDEEDPDVSDEEETEPETVKPQSSSTSIFGGSPKPGASIFGGTSTVEKPQSPSNIFAPLSGEAASS